MDLVPENARSKPGNVRFASHQKVQVFLKDSPATKNPELPPTFSRVDGSENLFCVKCNFSKNDSKLYRPFPGSEHNMPPGLTSVLQRTPAEQAYLCDRSRRQSCYRYALQKIKEIKEDQLEDSLVEVVSRSDHAFEESQMSLAEEADSDEESEIPPIPSASPVDLQSKCLRSRPVRDSLDSISVTSGLGYIHN